MPAVTSLFDSTKIEESEERQGNKLSFRTPKKYRSCRRVLQAKFEKEQETLLGVVPEVQAQKEIASQDPHHQLVPPLQVDLKAEMLEILEMIRQWKKQF